MFTLLITTQLQAQLGENQQVTPRPKNILEFSLGESFLDLTETLTTIEDIIFSAFDGRFSYKVPFREPVINHRWKSIGGEFKDIAVGESGELFAIDEKNLLYKLSEGSWQYQGIKGKSLSGGIGKRLCLIGESDGAYFLKDNKWVKVKGKLDNFLSLGNGKFLGVEKDGQGRPSLYEDGRWSDLPGINLKEMSALSVNDIYGLREDYSVWHFDGVGWKKLVGKMKSITVVNEDLLLGIGINNGVYQYLDGAWVAMRGNSLFKIVALDDYQFYAISLSGEVWKSFLPQTPL
ncbi:MAG: hypothetical protein ACO2ZP_10880 [Bacteriovoracaceae bacterium]